MPLRVDIHARAFPSAYPVAKVDSLQPYMPSFLAEMPMSQISVKRQRLWHKIMMSWAGGEARDFLVLRDASTQAVGLGRLPLPMTFLDPRPLPISTAQRSASILCCPCLNSGIFDGESRHCIITHEARLTIASLKSMSDQRR